MSELHKCCYCDYEEIEEYFHPKYIHGEKYCTFCYRNKVDILNKVIELIREQPPQIDRDALLILLHDHFY